MMFFLGLFVGVILGFIVLSLFVGGNSQNADTMEAFDEGVSYGLNLGREHGAIIATNKDEIMVQYKDGMIKRFREVKNDEES